MLVLLLSGMILADSKIAIEKAVTLHSIHVGITLFGVSTQSCEHTVPKLHEYTKMDIALEQHHYMCVLDTMDKK